MYLLLAGATARSGLDTALGQAGNLILEAAIAQHPSLIGGVADRRYVVMRQDMIEQGAISILTR